jgi:DNA-binding transcriptional ArsR family regulator
VPTRRNGNENRERLVAICGALSDPTRMEMLEEIVRKGEVGCSEFDQRFPLSKSTLSYHAKILNAAGLIETRREGRFFYYRPVLEVIESEMPGLIQRMQTAWLSRSSRTARPRLASGQN